MLSSQAFLKTNINCPLQNAVHESESLLKFSVDLCCSESRYPRKLLNLSSFLLEVDDITSILVLMISFHQVHSMNPMLHASKFQYC